MILDCLLKEAMAGGAEFQLLATAVHGMMESELTNYTVVFEGVEWPDQMSSLGCYASEMFGLWLPAIKKAASRLIEVGRERARELLGNVGLALFQNYEGKEAKMKPSNLCQFLGALFLGLSPASNSK